jgi:hypothetical protein
VAVLVLQRINQGLYQEHAFVLHRFIYTASGVALETKLSEVALGVLQRWHKICSNLLGSYVKAYYSHRITPNDVKRSEFAMLVLQRA